MNSNDRKKNWTKYWSESSRKTCGAGIESADSEVDRFWLSCAEKITPNMSVLDLCTGKGGVIDQLIMAQTKNNHESANYFGADFSSVVDGFLLEKYPKFKNNIKIYNSTSIDRLPFNDQSIDLITSQFGIEYSLTKETLDEVFRVLKPGGELQIVAHHSDSILAKVAEIELQHAQFLKTNGTYFECVENLIPIFSKLKNPANVSKLKNDVVAQNWKQQFNRETDVLLGLIQKSKCPDLLRESLEMSQKVFGVAQTQGMKYAKQMYINYREDLEDNIIRLQDLIGCAFDEDAVNLFQKTLAAYDRQLLKQENLHSDKELVAWGLLIK